VVSVALAPLAVTVYLHEATDYVYPFHEDPYRAITVMATFVLLCSPSSDSHCGRLLASSARA